MQESKFNVGDIVSYDFSNAWRGGKGQVTEVNGGHFRVKSIEVPEGARNLYPDGDHSHWEGDYLILIQPKQEPIVSGEAVEHPAHYGGDTVYEVIKVAEAWGLDKDAYLFNVVKYVGRAGKKSKATLLQDLKKARFYLDRRIKELEG